MLEVKFLHTEFLTVHLHNRIFGPGCLFQPRYKIMLGYLDTQFRDVFEGSDNFDVYFKIVDFILS